MRFQPVTEDADAVQPVFGVESLDDDLASVPFAGGAERLVGNGGDFAVERGGGFVGDQTFGAEFVVKDLIFLASGGVDAVVALFIPFAVGVEDAGVAAGGDLPFEAEFEVVVDLVGGEAGHHVAVDGVEGGFVFFDLPAVFGEALAAIDLPAVAGAAVKEGLPGGFGGDGGDREQAEEHPEHLFKMSQRGGGVKGRGV